VDGYFTSFNPMLASGSSLDILNFAGGSVQERMVRMFYLSPGPIMWVTPLTAFVTPVPPTASYYTVPTYYAPPAAPEVPVAYGAPPVYGAPVAYEPSYYSYMPSVSPPRGEYRLGRCLLIC